MNPAGGSEAPFPCAYRFNIVLPCEHLDQASQSQDLLGKILICYVKNAMRPLNPRITSSQLSMQILEEAAAAAQQNGGAAKESGVLQTSEFDELHPGRRLSSPLPCDPAKTTSTPGTSRFSATILDVSGRVAEAALQSCCVFMTPQVCFYDFIFAGRHLHLPDC